MRYSREKKTATNNFCECGGTVYHILKEKKRGGGGGIPMSIKSMGICDCGAVHWKNDLTDLAKEEWGEYVLESSESMRRYTQWRKAYKNGEIDKDEWNRIKWNAENGAGW
jgi:hypothetical protein